MLTLLSVVTTLTAFTARPAATVAESIEYPPTERVDQYDDYHGERVHDPYRWLEEDVRESGRVARWVETENKVTFEYLGEIPQRESIEQRLSALWNYERFSAPIKVGGRYFLFRNDGLQEQSALYVSETRDGDGRILLDPNTWSEDGTLALGDWSPSPDGKYAAYAVNDAGSDWQTWHVVDVGSGTVLEDTIEWTKFTGATWSRDGKGFFYGRYDAPAEGAEFQSVNLNEKVFYHLVGSSNVNDALVYARPDFPEWTYWTGASEDGRYLVIHAVVGTDARYRVFYRDLAQPDSATIELIDNFDYEYSFIGSNGPVLYFQTNLNAPRRRVIAIDIRDSQPDAWREVVAQTDDTLISIVLLNNQFVAQYLKDAKSAVRIYSEDGALVRDVDLPGIGTASGFGGERADQETFYRFSSYATPPSNYRYDLMTGKSELVWRASVDFSSDD